MLKSSDYSFIEQFDEMSGKNPDPENGYREAGNL